MRRFAQHENAELASDLHVRSAVSEPLADNLDESRAVSAFPDGGREAWTCLLGSFLMMFPSFGFQTAGKKICHLSVEYESNINAM